MRSISSLLGNHIIAPGRKRFHKGLSSEALAKRKQQRRLKRMNTYARDYTNQQIPHNWLNPKRIKQIGLYFQTHRNIHPISTPISEELKKQWLEKMKQDSEWAYYVNRNQIEQMYQERNAYKESRIQEQLQKIPAKLRKQILSDKQYPIPELADMDFLYNQQAQLIYPLDIRHRLNTVLQSKIKIEGDSTKKDIFE